MNNTNTDLNSLLLRLALGITLLAHGLLKVMVFTVAGTVGFFESMGLPAITAYLTIGGELLAGVALIAGVYTRLAAALSLPILLGATWAHASNGWVFSNQGGGWEFPAMLVVLAIVVSLTDAGKYALGSRFTATS
ncbi:MAG: DoxX family protein [Pseudomonadota bacterium]